MIKVDIRYARDEDLNKVFDLWRAGFTETEEWLAFFFKNRYRSEFTLTANDGGTLCASLQSVPVTFLYMGAELAASYIFGVVTHPGRRRSGCLKALMRRIVQDNYKAGVLISTLIPAEDYLFEVYGKYGFFESFFISEQRFDLSGGGDGINVRKLDNMDRAKVRALYEFYTKLYKAADYSVIKNEDDFIFYVTDFIIFDGEIYLAYKNGAVAACAFLAGRGGERFVKEYLFEETCAGDAALRQILKETGQNGITVKSPPVTDDESAKPKPFGMARVINVFSVLQSLCSGTARSFTVKVTDPVIAQNNNVFIVCGGKVRAKDINGRRINADLEVDIRGFTEFALTYSLNINNYLSRKQGLYGYMNLMLND